MSMIEIIDICKVQITSDLHQKFPQSIYDKLN